MLFEIEVCQENPGLGLPMPFPLEGDETHYYGLGARQKPRFITFTPYTSYARLVSLS